MKNRKEKLDELKKRSSRDNLQFIASGTEFLEIFDYTVKQFKEILNMGVEVNNIDEFLVKLSDIKSLEQPLAELKESIGNIKAPEEVKVAGLDDIIKAIGKIKTDANVQIDWLNKDNINPITKKLDEVIKASGTIKIANNQASEYIPMRKVVKVGNALMWDDSIGGGAGGGGSTTPLKNGSVPVVNPDGTNIGGGGGGGGGASTVADGADVAEGATTDVVVAAGAGGTVSAKLRRVTTDLDAVKTSVASVDTKTPASPATSAKQDTGNTSLSNIDTSTSAANTVLGAKTDAKSASTDATSVSQMQVLKQISASVQAPPSQAVTNAGTFAVQATQSGNWTARVVGNGGATVDGVIGAATAPTNMFVGGGVYNSSNLTLTNGQSAALQEDVNAFLRVSLATALSQAIDSVTAYPFGHSFVNMTTGTTTTIKSGSGVLHAIIINTPVASATIAIFDNTAGSGTTIGKITLGATLANDMEGSYLYDVAFSTGLTIVTSGATDITISYR